MSTDAQRKINLLMRDEGFKLIRATRHFVWSNGEIQIVTAASVSDERAFKNIRTQVRRSKKGKP